MLDGRIVESGGPSWPKIRIGVQAVRQRLGIVPDGDETPAIPRIRVLHGHLSIADYLAWVGRFWKLPLMADRRTERRWLEQLTATHRRASSTRSGVLVLPLLEERPTFESVRSSWQSLLT